MPAPHDNPEVPRRVGFRVLRGPLLTLCLLLAPTLVWPDLFVQLGNTLDATAKVARSGLLAAIWIAGAWLLVRLLKFVVWDGIAARRLGGKVPTLLEDVVAAVIFATAISGMLALVFDLDVTGLWATSGVVGLVLGFALQSMIADVASGIALNVDRPFQVGDWIRLSNRAREHIVGEVVECNWRSTRIRCVDGTMVSVPNGWIARDIVVNLTRPQLESRFEMRFCLDFDVPVERALRILEAGVRTAKGVLATPAPKVRVYGPTRTGVEYEIRYWLVCSETSPSKGRHQVASAVLDQLHRAGLTLAYDKYDVFTAELPTRQLDIRRHRQQIVARVDLFADLQPTELAQLATTVREVRMGRGADVVRHGEAGESMYILVEGLLEVLVPMGGAAGSEEVLVGQIRAGEFFGEMSLLTGEPRSATVRCATDIVAFEVRKPDLEQLVTQRPALALAITEKVAERRLRSQRRLAEANAAPPSEEETRSLTAQILGRMRGLFGMS